MGNMMFQLAVYRRAQQRPQLGCGGRYPAGLRQIRNGPVTHGGVFLPHAEVGGACLSSPGPSVRTTTGRGAQPRPSTFLINLELCSSVGEVGAVQINELGCEQPTRRPPPR